MPEHSGRVTAENLLNNFMETFEESAPKQSSATLFESTEKSTVSESFNRPLDARSPFIICSLEATDRQIGREAAAKARRENVAANSKPNGKGIDSDGESSSPSHKTRR